eukprot:1840734-Rhodomonas_salina.2
MDPTTSPKSASGARVLASRGCISLILRASRSWMPIWDPGQRPVMMASWPGMPLAVWGRLRHAADLT